MTTTTNEFAGTPAQEALARRLAGYPTLDAPTVRLPAFDRPGTGVALPDDHILDHLARSNDLLDELTTSWSSPVGTLAVVSGCGRATTAPTSPPAWTSPPARTSSTTSSACLARRTPAAPSSASAPRPS
jgi:hypothetical protein